MKTFAHINVDESIVAIGMIYLENGSFTPGVQKLVNELGVDAGILAVGEKARAGNPDLVTIVIDTDEMPGGNGMSFDKTFRGAFKKGAGSRIDVDMPKAKEIAHERRRNKRATEFAPLDIEATIPMKATEAESKRQNVRDKYDVIQNDIDAVSTPDELKALIEAQDI